MCPNAAVTAANLMAALEPTLKSLLTATGQIDTPNGIAAINAYNAALAALQTWKSGTNAQNVIQIIGAFQSVFNTLPLPPTVLVFEQIIEAALVTIIGILMANSPAPAGITDIGVYQAHIAAETSEKVQVLVPTFHRSIFHSVEAQFRKAWNDAVAANPRAGVVAV